MYLVCEGFAEVERRFEELPLSSQSDSFIISRQIVLHNA